MQIFPNTIQDFVNSAGRILKPWIQYLQQFTQSPPNFINLTVGSSPFSYSAKEPGYIYIFGGTVSVIQLIRGTIAFSIGIVSGVAGQTVPVSINDTVKITYSVKPSVWFIPIYGAVVS